MHMDVRSVSALAPRVEARGWSPAIRCSPERNFECWTNMTIIYHTRAPLRCDAELSIASDALCDGEDLAFATPRRTQLNKSIEPRQNTRCVGMS